MLRSISSVAAVSVWLLLRSCSVFFDHILNIEALTSRFFFNRIPPIAINIFKIRLCQVRDIKKLQKLNV